MLETLKEILIHLWDELKPAYIVNEYEGAVLLHLGKYKRTDGPGLHWKIPLIEETIVTSMAVTTAQPGSQSLMTKDDQKVVINTVVKYNVKDVKPYLLEIEDRDDVLTDVVMGAVREVVRESAFNELDEADNKIKKKVRSEVGRYGFKIHDVTIVDVSPIETMRLMHDGIIIGE